MEAYTLVGTGGVECLHRENIACPDIGPDEVLVKTKALSLNPVDIKARKGGPAYTRIAHDTPIILGWDISGEIVAIGQNVSDFSIGDEAFGMIRFPGHGRCYTEFVSCPVSHIAKKPQNISHTQAAASCLSCLTAYQALQNFESKKQKNPSILIQGVTGGVGSFAVQIARKLGYLVYGTCSTGNAEIAQKLGCEHVLNYAVDDLQSIENIDFILDIQGGENLRKMIDRCHSGSYIISLAGPIHKDIQDYALSRGVTVEFLLVQSSGEDMKKIATMLQDGIIQPLISQIFGFDDLRLAHLEMESKKLPGKIVILV